MLIFIVGSVGKVTPAVEADPTKLEVVELVPDDTDGAALVAPVAALVVVAAAVVAVSPVPLEEVVLAAVPDVIGETIAARMFVSAVPKDCRTPGVVEFFETITATMAIPTIADSPIAA
jgi:hypothetical protein